ncbi:hypothetical protein GCM10020221_12560 [Streptomyces thioluteus]|uniref:FAD-binding domain-containing protein n=1 Tax=Streptomyces thioluteus TaxID=66431 RepID=A0ABN3WL54_STRTU
MICARGEGAGTKRYLDDFIGRLGLAGFEPSVSSGHLTRCRSDDSPLSRGRVIVCGDAAGLLEPWTREGISFALRSGKLAGEWAVRIAEAQDAVDARRQALNYAFAIKAGLGVEMGRGPPGPGHLQPEAGRLPRGGDRLRPGVARAFARVTRGRRRWRRSCGRIRWRGRWFRRRIGAGGAGVTVGGFAPVPPFLPRLPLGGAPSFFRGEAPGPGHRAARGWGGGCAPCTPAPGLRPGPVIAAPPLVLKRRTG